MLFNSFTFAVFFTIVYWTYWLNKRSYKRQNFILFGASYIFYGWWDARFLFLLVIATFIDYTATLLIDQKRLAFNQKLKAYSFLIGAAFLFVFIQKLKFQLPWPIVSGFRDAQSSFSGWWVLFATFIFLGIFEILQKVIISFKFFDYRKFYLFWAVSLNLSILCIFKYLNFFRENFINLWSWLFGYVPTELTLNIVLPVGVSFFIFQTISHTVDVYRKKIQATQSLLEVITFIAFFPQLVAGPIERGAHLLPQFQRIRIVTSEEKKEALWLIVWGFYKKIVIADNVAKIVNENFQPFDLIVSTDILPNGLTCLVAVYAFAVQIYCDFSGYTDIARGTARLLGFDIMLNFNLPYFAINPSDFWRRWHISLSSWLRDYLYIPLGGNRKGTFSMYRNLMITMLLGGLWHGASWNFVFWGFFHGILLVVFNIFNQKDTGKSFNGINLLKGIMVFHLVCLGWLLFRAQNMSTVLIFLEATLTNFKNSPQALEALNSLIFYSWFLIGYQAIQGFTQNLNPLKNFPWFARLNVWLFLIISMFSLGEGTSQEFIYFAF